MSTRLPRRLRLDLLDPPLACVSHVVAAGPDYSGRPNFFAHGLIVQLGDEDADDRGFLRPADLWDADLWLRPLGAKEVEFSDPDPELRQLRRGSARRRGPRAVHPLTTPTSRTSCWRRSSVGPSVVAHCWSSATRLRRRSPTGSS